ncbi:gliding motility protein GldN [Nemorincola caseinilytica]|uniref:type IX secretion system ring protein PorN/GldN n=1 Tax=Nemorincola caseinilytica TaxID=2054315 RepID=UPI0031E94689
MKKSILYVLLVFLAVGATSTYLEAQTSPKKKKKKKENTVNQDSLRAARTADSLAQIAAAAPPPAPPAEEENPFADLVSDDTGFHADFSLDSTKPVDGYYKQTNLRGAKPFAFPKENKNNIKFYKRIWREIDLTDSSNKIFATPGETLISLIMDALKYKKLIAYQDEGFKKQLSYAKVVKAFSDSALVPVLDSITGDVLGYKTVFNDFNPDSVTKFEIKEDIYFDKTRGRVITQVIGLSPVIKLKSSQGDYIGDMHPFWLYYPQCRNLFAAREVIDPQRDIYNESYDDMFVQRRFVSRIVKESNPADLRIKDKYPSDLERQKKESDRIEREINNYKKNLWKY